MDDHPIPLSDRIEAWTVSQAADVLRATSISTPAKQPRTSLPLAISLDDDYNLSLTTPPRPREPTHKVHSRTTPIRRDSQHRRATLLKGVEGSRRRQRWENDRLLSNPHAQPPLPSDWAIAPTHNAHNVPYFLAPLWDAEYARKAAERKVQASAPALGPEEAAAQKVARDLRAKLKRAQGAKGLLQDLEREVRGFVAAWEGKQRELEREGLIEGSDSEDEEIVFVGRGGVTRDEVNGEQKEGGKLEKDKLIFQSLVDDHGASFGYVLPLLSCCARCSDRDVHADFPHFPDGTSSTPSQSTTA
jgi:hypothetical protein